MRRALPLVALLAASPALIGAVSDQPVLLRYHFSEGQKLTYRAEYGEHLVLKNHVGKLGNLDVRSEYRFDLRQDVKSVGQGSEFELSARPRSVEVKITGPMAKASGALASKLEKVGLRFKIDARGRVKDLHGEKGTPKALAKMVGSLKNALRRLLPMLPTEAKRPGESWRQQLKLPVTLPSGEKLQAVVTVDYWHRGYAHVQGRLCAHLAMRLHLGIAGTMGQRRNRVAVTGHGGGHGFAFLDLEEGILVDTGVAVKSQSFFRGRQVRLDQRSEVWMRMGLKKK